MDNSKLELREFPFAWALSSSKLDSLCSFCLAKPTTPLRCSRCKLLRYCSPICQRNDWSDHKPECSAIGPALQQNFPVPDDGVRLLFRIWHKTGKKPEGRTMDDLVSHAQEIRQCSEAWQAFQRFCTEKFFPFCAFGKMRMPTQEEILISYGRVMVNAFGIKNQELQSVGIGLYLNLCRLDHSCDPNARIVYYGREAVVVPIKNSTWTEEEISVKDGVVTWRYDRIFHSYIENIVAKSDRQEQLRREYLFDCQCTACSNQDRNAQMEALVCTSTRGCEGIVLAANQFDCSRCGCVLEEVDTAQMALTATKSTLEKLSLLGDRVDAEAKFALCTKVLCLQEGVFSKRNVARGDLLRMAYESAVKMSRWKDAVVYGEGFLESRRMYFAKLDPWLGAMLKNFGKVCANAKEEQKAKKILEEAREILKHAFGEESEVVGEIDAILKR